MFTSAVGRVLENECAGVLTGLRSRSPSFQKGFPKLLQAHGMGAWWIRDPIPAVSCEMPAG